MYFTDKAFLKLAELEYTGLPYDVRMNDNSVQCLIITGMQNIIMNI